MNSIKTDKEKNTSLEINATGKNLASEELSFFPTPYPDELAYSIFVRFHLWSGHLFSSVSKVELFGSKDIKPYSFLPHRLNWLTGKMPNNSLLTSDYLINKHTLFPLFRPFLPTNKSVQIISHMKGGASKNKSGLPGFGCSKIKWSKFLKYCPECLKVDENLYGESYWHRSHQPFGVEICHKHSAWLFESSIAQFDLSGQDTFSAPNSANTIGRERTRKSSKYYPLFKSIADYVHWLLNNTIHIDNLVDLKKAYIFYLKKMSIANYWGHIDPNKLRLHFERNYDKIFLRQMKSSITSKYDWLFMIARKPTSFIQPIRHILLQLSLNINPEEFWNLKVVDEPPFGKAPWPCLNPASKHYLKYIIKDCRIIIDKNKHFPKGLFSCTCGFKYTRKGPDKTIDDRFRIDQLISGGSVLYRKIRKLRKDGKTIRQIAQTLHINDGTVYKIIKATSKSYTISSKKEQDFRRDTHRRAFERLLQRHPNLNRWKLSSLAGGLYNWLQEHDKNWLLRHMPARRPSRLGAHQSPIDWKLRDGQLSKQLILATKRFQKNHDKPIRITRNLLLSLLTHKNSLPLDKLPKTKKLILSMIEKPDDFHMRRLKFAIEEATTKGKSLSISYLRNKVCSFYNCSPFVIKEIEKAVLK